MYDHYNSALRYQARLGCDELGLTDRTVTAEVTSRLAATLESDVAAVLDSVARLVNTLETDEDDARAWALFEEIGAGTAVAMATGYRILATLGLPSAEDTIGTVLSSTIEPVW